MRDEYPFISDVDNLWYFWLGNSLSGPFDEYSDAHAELTRLTEAHGKEDSQESKA